MYLLLFDIDGTLLHTNGFSREIFSQALEETFGVPIDWTYDIYQGQPDRQLARQLLMQAGKAEDQIEAGLSRAFDRVGALWKEKGSEAEIFVYPGVQTLLSTLQNRPDVALGQVTANVKPAALGKLQAAGIDGNLFPVGAYGEEADDRDLLPPLAIRRAGAYWRRPFPAEKVVIIGDSPADIRSARAAGARSLAVATGRYDIEQLAACRPDGLLPDLADLAQTLVTLNLT